VADLWFHDGGDAQNIVNGRENGVVYKPGVACSTGGGG